MEQADPPGPLPDRRDLRHLETLLWLSANAMARDRQSRSPSPPHRHRLQSQTNPKHPNAGPISAPPANAPIAEPWPPQKNAYPSIIEQKRAYPHTVLLRSRPLMRSSDPERSRSIDAIVARKECVSELFRSARRKKPLMGKVSVSPCQPFQVES